LKSSSSREPTQNQARHGEVNHRLTALSSQQGERNQWMEYRKNKATFHASPPTGASPHLARVPTGNSPQPSPHASGWGERGSPPGRPRAVRAARHPEKLENPLVGDVYLLTTGVLIRVRPRSRPDSAAPVSSKDRATLAEHLISSLDVSLAPDVEIAWQQEMQRRLMEMTQGEVVGIPWEEVRDRFRGRAVSSSAVFRLPSYTNTTRKPFASWPLCMYVESPVLDG
jgi:putative addiction module component (TIGR02574 family)